jgi:hypothetical protein
MKRANKLTQECHDKGGLRACNQVDARKAARKSRSAPSAFNRFSSAIVAFPNSFSSGARRGLWTQAAIKVGPFKFPLNF